MFSKMRGEEGVKKAKQMTFFLYYYNHQSFTMVIRKKNEGK